MTNAAYDDDEDAGGAGQFFSQIPAILFHRKWLIIIPMVIGVIAAIAALLLLPTTYRSSATILVQSPQLPDEVVGANAMDSVDRRIARIREQITSRPDLLALMDEHGLYTSERARKPLSTVVEQMRKAIVLTPTSSAAGSVPSGKDATISFELSFDYARPIEAQAVAQDLTQRLIQLDSSQTSVQAQSTVQFLSDQAAALQKQISDVETQMTGISATNGRALAGSAPMITNSGGIDVQIAQLQRDTSLMLSQRQALQNVETGDPQVVAAQAQLKAMQAIYSDNHPDVIAARQRLAQAKANAPTYSPRQSSLQQLDEQIAFNNAQIAALRASKAGENAQLAASLSAQARGPMAQQQLAQLQQRLSGLNEQYRSVSARVLAAKAGVRADAEQMGQKLTVVEPPVVPDTPYWPNRLLVGALGPLAGLALGLVLALAAEMLMRPIRSPEALFAFTNEAPLTVIPVLDARAQRRAHKRGMKRFALSRSRQQVRA